MAKNPGMFSKEGLKGLEKVMSNLNKEILAIKTRTMAGLIEASEMVHKDMEVTPPIIPRDTGNLRDSWTLVRLRDGETFGVKIGFTANYAAAVHEMVGADFTSTRTRYGPGKGQKRTYTPLPGSGAKFFEASLKRNKNEILKIIADNAKVK